MPSAKAVSACSEFMSERVVTMIGYCKLTILLYKIINTALSLGISGGGAVVFNYLSSAVVPPHTPYCWLVSSA